MQSRPRRPSDGRDAFAMAHNKTGVSVAPPDSNPHCNTTSTMSMHIQSCRSVCIVCCRYVAPV